MICRTEALVLRGYRMSQSSKVAILFSQDYGKLRLSAKGARRPKSKFGASLEPMTWGIYTFYRRGDRDLQSLTEGDIRYAFGGLKKDYRRMVCGSSVCDLLDAITEDGGPNGLLYSAALEALRWTETVDEEALEAPMWGFQVRAAAALGYRPHLSDCVRCGGRTDGDVVRFDPILGGVLCPRHGSEGVALGQRAIGFLQQVLADRLDRIDLEPLIEIDRNAVNQALRSFIMHHVGNQKRIKSLEFWDNMMAAEGRVAYGSAPATGR